MQRKKPLRRGAPLQRKQPLRTPRPQTGKVTRKLGQRPTPPRGKRWAAWRGQERGAVVFRAMRGPGQPAQCEWPGCQVGGVEWHHLFGRRMEPWSSSRLLCLLLCKEHHDQAHARAANRRLLRFKALGPWVTWADKEFGLSMLQIGDPPLNPVEAEQWWRHALDIVRAEGIPPPYYADQASRTDAV